MENSINYQLENENLRLKIELCNKQLELKEKEIILKDKEIELLRVAKDKEIELSRVAKDKEPIILKPTETKEVDKVLNPIETKEEPIETEADDFKNTKEVEELYHVEPKKADEKEPKKLILMKDKVKKTFGINEDVILEQYIEPKITLVNSSPKKYIKQYKLDIVSRYIEDQIINNRNIIKEKLIDDLKKT